MSISFPLSTAVQLSMAETLTRAWAKGLPVCWPDEGFWKLETTNRPSLTTKRKLREERLVQKAMV